MAVASLKPTLLLVVANSATAAALRARLGREGYEAIVATTSVALQAAVASGVDVRGALLDIRTTKDGAMKVLGFLRRILPEGAPIYASDQVADEATLKDLETTGGLRRIGPLGSDPDGAVDRLFAVKERSEGARYDVNVINCFVASVNTVLEYYTQSVPELGKATVVPHKSVPAGYVTAIHYLEGPNCEGSASLTCEKNFIIDIAARVNGLSKAEAEGSREALIATTEELTDQIFGKAELLLKSLGFDFALSAPETHFGETEPIVLRGRAPVMLIPFSLRKKRFFIGFSLRLK